MSQLVSDATQNDSRYIQIKSMPSLNKTLTLKSRDVILKTLGSLIDAKLDPKDLAIQIEEQIFEASNQLTDNNCRNSIRSHFLNLKVSWDPRDLAGVRV